MFGLHCIKEICRYTYTHTHDCHRLITNQDVISKFDRGHPVVLILTNNIQYFSSDTNRLYIRKNVITGLLVSVSQNHLSDPLY